MDEKQKTPWTERSVTRWIANLLAATALLALVLFAWQRVVARSKPVETVEPISAPSVSEELPAQKSDPVNLSPLVEITEAPGSGISRAIDFKTIIPSRPRVEVITYTVQKGDNLFEIAEDFGIKPETLLWGNFETLKDNPQFLSPDQILNILPVNGVYYQWQTGDTAQNVALNFKTDPKAILEFPGNDLDLVALSEGKTGFEPGKWVIIPDGKRPLKDWGPPAITRQNPASARYYGEGSCGSVYEGAIGYGTFVWPTVNHALSGYTFTSLHPAIDIGGSTGDAILASDGGVVVYAGWSNFGYGYLIVIDHGNGYQTAYGHLSAVAVTCGQSVFQGGYIGGLGSTGNSSGPHLHFELVYNGAKLNPLDYTR